MNLNEIKFDELRFQEIGSWPLPLRIAVIVLSGILSVAIVYFLILSREIEVLAVQKQQEESKRKEFKDKYNLAANMKEYEKQMLEVNDYYKKIMNQLPPDSKIAELIDNISALAQKNNLHYDSIKLGDPKSSSGFYKEQDLDIVVTGGYHNFGTFLSDLAKLPRIVTLHDFIIKPVSNDKNKQTSVLSMTIEAKTYWLSMDKDEKGNPKISDKPVASVPGAIPGPPGVPGATPSNTPVINAPPGIVNPTAPVIENSGTPTGGR